MLLRGLYTFEPRPEDHNHTLPFSYNDKLLFLEVLKRDSEWLRVADVFGRVGYVPKSFVEPHESCSSPNLIQSFLVDAVVKARYYELPSATHLEKLRDHVRENPSMVRQRAEQMKKIFMYPSQGKSDMTSARRTTSDQHLNSYRIQKGKVSTGVRELRRVGSESELDIGTKPSKQTSHVSAESLPPRGASKPYNRAKETDECNSDSSVKTAVETADENNEAKAHSSMSGDDRNLSRTFASPSPSLQAIKSSLVNVVQESSGLDPILSENLLVEVFQCMKKSTSKIPVPVASLLEKLSMSSMSAPVSSKAISDLEKAMTTLEKLSRAGIKSGRDKHPQSFIEKLDTFRKSLINCDAVHATQLLQLGQHSFSQDFAHLYNLESPYIVKERMLDIFLIIFTLDKPGRARLLTSTLPIYLARDLMARHGNQDNERKLFLQLVNVLVSLLSCGEGMPETHFEILGTGFVNFILKEIESVFATAESEADDDKIKDDRLSPMINLLLVYNLQFSYHHPSKENIVLRVLSEWRKRPRGFFTVLMGLFKKAHDPLTSEVNHPQRQDYDHPSATLAPIHSVFKMLMDICLCKRTASHLTSSDKKRLVEIITDGLFDNPAGNIRLGYVQVLKSLLGSPHPGSSLEDIRTALLSILLDSDPLAVREQQLIRQMSKEYPILFIKSISKVKMNVVGGASRGTLRGQEQDPDDNDYSYLSS